eukprot:7202468-Prymnesium_polylepis.1
MATPLTALYSWVVSASHAASQAYRRAPTMSLVCTPPPRVRTSKTAADLTHTTDCFVARFCGRRLVPAAHE